MKQQLTRASFVSFSIAIGLAGVLGMSLKSSAALETAELRAGRDGATVYAKYCSRCHGADGKSKTAKGKQTRATDLTKSRIGNAAGIKIIANGKELMPGFKDSTTAQEMQAVMTYVKGFRQ
ncbi:MAG: cytochrome c [Pyrinomonadaceae bacterium]